MKLRIRRIVLAAVLAGTVAAVAPAVLWHQGAAGRPAVAAPCPGGPPIIRD